MSWLTKIAKVFPDGSDVRIYERPSRGQIVYTPRSRKGKVIRYIGDKRRYLVDVDGKHEEVHPKNIARPY